MLSSAGLHLFERRVALYQVPKPFQRLPPVIDRSGAQADPQKQASSAAVHWQQGESSQVLKRIGSHGIATSNQDEKVSTDIPK